MTAQQARRAGRPRSERVRRAVLAATLELAAELGPRGVSMDAIARRAGVSKETLYRWWRSKAGVVLEALADWGDRTIPLTDTGSLEADVRAFLRATVATVDPTVERLLRAVAAEAAADTAFAAEVRERFLSRRRGPLRELLERAGARGEPLPVEVALDLVYGSLWYRVIFGIGPLD